MERLYLVTRADLPIGDQATQAAHALSAFAVEHAALHAGWHTADKNLILLASPNKFTLAALLYDAANAGIPHAKFHEPDIDGELTAIALGEGARKLVSSLPLALKEPKRAA
jgi:Peptidyl-tRNA hydrolase PTH2